MIGLDSYIEAWIYSTIICDLHIGKKTQLPIKDMMGLPRDVAAGQQVLIEGLEAVGAIQSRKRHHVHQLRAFLDV